jgi:hypothetical protein
MLNHCTEPAPGFTRRILYVFPVWTLNLEYVASEEQEVPAGARLQLKGILPLITVLSPNWTWRVALALISRNLISSVSMDRNRDVPSATSSK